MKPTTNRLWLPCVALSGCTLVVPFAVGDAGGEAPHIVHGQGPDAMTTPCTGHIDPHVEMLSPPAGVGPGGITDARIKFNMPVYDCDTLEAVGPDNFVMVETGSAEPPQVIVAEYIDGDESYVYIEWDRTLTLQEWTTIIADVCSADGVSIDSAGDMGDDAGCPGFLCVPFDSSVAEPDRIDIGRLPVDMTQDRVVDPTDVLRWRQFVFGSCIDCPECGGATFFFDVDQSGSVGAVDLFRVRQALFGTLPAATQPWDGETLYSPRP